MRFLLALVLLAVSSPAWAQSVTLPAEIKGAPGAWIIVAPEQVEGGNPKWRIDAGLQEVRLDLLFPPELVSKAKGKVVTSTIPGRYKVEAWNAKGDVASDISTCWIVIGTPAPTPVPPPVPTPTPEPPPNPTPAGSRLILLVRESADSTPEVARLISNLRSGEAAAYLKSRSHSLYILDDDSLGIDGRPSKIVEAWRPHFKDLALPVLIIADAQGHLLHKESWAKETPASASVVLDVIKQWGG